MSPFPREFPPKHESVLRVEATRVGGRVAQDEVKSNGEVKAQAVA